MLELALASILAQSAAQEFRTDPPSFRDQLGRRFSAPGAAATSSTFATLLTGAVAADDECTNPTLQMTDGATLTWTRSTGKYCKKSDGTLVWKTANQPALEADGLNVEGTSANQVIRSQEACNTSTAWTLDAVTCTSDDRTAPDGATTAETVTTTTASGQHRLYSQAIVLSGRVTISHYVGAVSGSAHWARIAATSVISAAQSCNVATCAAGTTVGTGGAALPVGGCEAAADGWCRIWLSYTGDGTNGQRVMTKFGRTDAETAIGTAWSGEALAFKVWGAMQTSEDFLTSYYPTTTAAATRGADVVSFAPGTAISATGCAAATVKFRGAVNANGRIFGTSDTSSPAMIATATTSKIADGTNTQTITHSSVLNSSVAYRAVWSAASGTKNLTIASTSGTADTYDGTMNMGTVYLGSRAGVNDFLFGHIKSIKLGTTTSGCR